MQNDLMMWDCECGVIYEKNLTECPICHSEKRSKSKHTNFTPIELKKNDNITVNLTIHIGATNDN